MGVVGHCTRNDCAIAGKAARLRKETTIPFRQSHMRAIRPPSISAGARSAEVTLKLRSHPTPAATQGMGAAGTFITWTHYRVRSRLSKLGGASISRTGITVDGGPGSRFSAVELP